ncbi:hypothetical protein Leryth_011488 [Lithospermum erythrorhizon]|nr:hypothetical protein Leryth_011488 [Lithospermum erythrorhizon]
MLMSWMRIGTSFQAFGAHSLLLGFSILLLFKLDHTFNYSWWIIFLPLWLFHAVVARGRFSLPAPSVPHDRHWAPCHAVVAAPLLIAFELLLCIYLESTYVTGSVAVNLKVVFLPLLAFEATILVDNFRMCKALLPGDDESMSDEAVMESLPHLWVAFSMVFFLASTVFTLLKLSGGFDALGWWDLFVNFCIAEFFSFLLCMKWSNPMIHGNSNSQEASSSSSTITYLGGRSGQLVSSEDHSDEGCCLLPDIGGHIMKIPVIAFQLLLCMHLEGTPPSAKSIPLRVVFSPLLLLQGVGVLFAASRFTEKIVHFLRSGGGSGRYFTISSTAYELFEFFRHGSRFLGWWSIDDVSREERAQLYSSGSSGCI